jgi:HEAT repeat protein
MKDLAPDLVPMLKDDDLFVRSLAMQVIGDFGAVDAVPALIDVLETPSATIRKYAGRGPRAADGLRPAVRPRGQQGRARQGGPRWKDWIAGKPQ